MNDFKYLFLLFLLFLIECEYSYRINLCDLEDLDKFEEKIEFIAQKNADPKNANLKFKKAKLKWKHTNSRKFFPKIRCINHKRALFAHHCVRLFGEEKLIDFIEKTKPDLIEKYGETIHEDLEVFEILIKHFRMNDFKKRIKSKT